MSYSDLYVEMETRTGDLGISPDFTLSFSLAFILAFHYLFYLKKRKLLEHKKSQY